MFKSSHTHFGGHFGTNIIRNGTISTARYVKSVSYIKKSGQDVSKLKSLDVGNNTYNTPNIVDIVKEIIRLSPAMNEITFQISYPLTPEIMDMFSACTNVTKLNLHLFLMEVHGFDLLKQVVGKFPALKLLTVVSGDKEYGTEFDHFLSFCRAKPFKTEVIIDGEILDTISVQNRPVIKYINLTEWHPDVVELPNLERIKLVSDTKHLVRVLCTPTLLPKLKAIDLSRFLYEQQGSRTTLEKFIQVRGGQLKSINLVVSDRAKQLVQLLANANLVLDSMDIEFDNSTDASLNVDDVRSLFRISVRWPLMVETTTTDFKDLLAVAYETEPNKKCRINLRIIEHYLLTI